MCGISVEYISFPDQISIEDFSAGAMENWGLITYREIRMVVDTNHTTLFETQRATGTLGHEFLHQVRDSDLINRAL